MSNLAEIKTALSNLTALVDKMEKSQTMALTIPEFKIYLQPGERYAGLILDEEGKPGHHIILLPGDHEANWNDAKEMATKAGADLPTRREQSLLFANLNGEFQAAWYWSGEQYSENYAWGQYFGNGNQFSYGSKDYARRCRFVRRLMLQSFGTLDSKVSA